MSTPAGWYPDPSAEDPTGARLRWWDGARWTDHVHAPEPRTTVPPSGRGPVDAPGLDPHQQFRHSLPQQPPQQHPPSKYPAPGVRAIATPDGQALAGLGMRLLARIIDTLLIGIITYAAGWSSVQTLDSLYTDALDSLAAGNSEALFALADDRAFAAPVQNLTLIALAVSAAYSILSIRFYGCTPGKAVCRVRVRAWDRPGLPTWGQSVVRWMGSDLLGQLFALWYLVDFLWPCWDQRKQALHDKMARTVVVRR